MRRSLAPDLGRLVLAAAAATLVLALGGFAGQGAALLLGAVAGIVVFRRGSAVASEPSRPSARRRATSLLCVAALVVLLVGLPLASERTSRHDVELAEAMTRSGALVFGGGHVVLPLLHEAVVVPHWVARQEFLAGYGLAQAMPGPLFTFSAYLGAIEEPSPSGVPGAALALLAIFLPSFLLLGAVLPIWASTRHSPIVRSGLTGVSAAVVGLLAAALWDPVVTTSIDGVGDALFAAVLLALLRVLPVWTVVPLAAAAAELLF
jgi:chromate transporter